MARYTSSDIDPHGREEIIGVLLINLGTPDAPNAKALRRYLGEFLWDPRVVSLPRWLWWLILHGIILRIRPKRSAKLYQQIWLEQGSPLLVYSQQLAQQLSSHLTTLDDKPVKVELAMRYGNPSIPQGLRALRDANATRIIVLPLYPQYSATTSGSTFDAVSAELQTWRWIPKVDFINHYADNNHYIAAIAKSINQHWQQHGKSEKLLMSFHGLPKSYCQAGDPYYCFCLMTAKNVAKQLQLNDDQWQLVFQSRFGLQPWLQPYCDDVLKKLAKQGVKSVDIICPGFATDCLETLQEIAIEYKHLFMQAGGEQFNYIPALNAGDAHAMMLAKIIDPK